MTMRILGENVSKSLLQLKEGICPAVYIHLFYQRGQVHQARFSLGKSILASPSQAAVLKSFLGTCSINYIGMQVRLTSLVVLWIFLLSVFGRWTWFAIFQMLKNFSVCLIDSNVHLHSRKPTVPWTASKETWQAGLGRWFSLSTPPLWDPAWNTESSSGHTCIVQHFPPLDSLQQGMRLL